MAHSHHTPLCFDGNLPRTNFQRFGEDDDALLGFEFLGVWGTTQHTCLLTPCPHPHDARRGSATTHVGQRERMASPTQHYLTINTLPSEAHNLLLVLLLCAYACWVLRAAVRFYHSWRITRKCVPRDRVVLVEGLGHRVEVSRRGGLRVGKGERGG